MSSTKITEGLEIGEIVVGMRLWHRSNDEAEPDTLVIEQTPEGKWLIENPQGFRHAFAADYIRLHWRMGPDKAWVRRACAQVEADERAAEAIGRTYEREGLGAAIGHAMRGGR